VKKKRLEIFIAIFCSRIQWGNTQPFEIQIWYYAGQREKKIQFETGYREQLFFFFFSFFLSALQNESQLRIGYLYPVASFGRLFMRSDMQGNCVLHVKYFVVFILPR
jgi:hypothetical protein